MSVKQRLEKLEGAQTDSRSLAQRLEEARTANRPPPTAEELDAMLASSDPLARRIARSWLNVAAMREAHSRG
ncbi:MAG TPA: hypothetical protein VIN36_09135 [Thiobacillus sp.]